MFLFLGSLRFALRRWVRKPWVPLALIAIIAFLNWMLLTSLAAMGGITRSVDRLGNQDRLIAIRDRYRATGRVRQGVSNLLLDEIRGGSRTVADVAPVVDDPLLQLTVRTPSGYWYLRCGAATSRFFTLFRVPAALGRLFTEEDDAAGGAALLSREAWRRYFGSSRDVVGTRITVNRQPFTVIGVLVEESVQPEVMVWLNRAVASESGLFNFGGTFRLTLRASVYGRLRDGASLAAAQQEMEEIYAQLASYEPPLRELTPSVVTAREQLLSTAGPIVRGMVYLAIALSVLSIVNLWLMRNLSGQARGYEVAVRRAIGAPVSLVVAEAAAEAFLVVLLGVVAGLVCRAATSATTLSFLDVQLSELALAPLAWWQTGLLIGMNALGFLSLAIPDALFVLRAGDSSVVPQRQESAGRRGMVRRRWLTLAVQAGIATGLLLFCGLLVQVLWRGRAAEAVFRAEGLVVARTCVTGPKYAADSAVRGYRGRALEAIREMPGVLGAGTTSFFPVLDTWMMSYLTAPGVPIQNVMDPRHEVDLSYVDASYLGTMQIPLLAGEEFAKLSEGERAGSIIVDEDAAKRLASSGRGLVGRTLQLVDTPYRVAGVVRAVRFRGEAGRDRPQVFLYSGTAGEAVPWSTVVVRSARPEREMAAALNKRLSALDPEMPPLLVEPASVALARATLRQRRLVWVAGILACFALLVAGFSELALVVEAIGSRRVELGIKQALGITSARLLKETCGAMLLAIAAGSLAGAAGLFYVARRLTDLFYAASFDPWMVAAVLCMMLLGGLAGALGPVQRFRKSEIASLLRAL